MANDILNDLIEMEDLILQRIILNPEYAKKVIPKLSTDVFNTKEAKLVYKDIKKFNEKYRKVPNPSEISILVNESENKKDLVMKLKSILSKGKSNIHDKFLLDKTETYIKEKKFLNFMLDNADRINAKEVNLSKALSDISEIAAISLDTKKGVSFEDITDRIKYYKRYEIGIRSNIHSLDKLLFPGFKKKTLTIFAAKSGGGKSAFMACLAGNIAMNRKNVLIISLEMAEMEYFKRIDANLLDIPIKELRNEPLQNIIDRYNAIKSHIGEIKVIEYPTGSLSPLQLEAVLDDLKNTEEFVPDIIFVDYLSIMKSDTIRDVGNSNTYYGSIAEGLRSVAMKYNVPIISASQITRDSIDTEKLDQSGIAYSKKVFETADNVIAIISTPELYERNEIMLNPLKNRNTGILNKKIILSADFSKMRFTDNNPDVDNKYQEDLQNVIEEENNGEEMNIIENNIFEDTVFTDISEKSEAYVPNSIDKIDVNDDSWINDNSPEIQDAPKFEEDTTPPKIYKAPEFEDDENSF